MRLSKILIIAIGLTSLKPLMASGSKISSEEYGPSASDDSEEYFAYGSIPYDPEEGCFISPGQKEERNLMRKDIADQKAIQDKFDSDIRKELKQLLDSENLDGLKNLISKHPRLLKLRNERGFTPLFEGVFQGKLELVETLLKLGADPKEKLSFRYDATVEGYQRKEENLRNILHIPCLFITLVKKDEKMFSLLLSYDADPNAALYGELFNPGRFDRHAIDIHISKALPELKGELSELKFSSYFTSCHLAPTILSTSFAIHSNLPKFLELLLLKNCEKFGSGKGLTKWEHISLLQSWEIAHNHQLIDVLKEFLSAYDFENTDPKYSYNFASTMIALERGETKMLKYFCEQKIYPYFESLYARERAKLLERAKELGNDEAAQILLDYEANHNSNKHTGD